MLTNLLTGSLGNGRTRGEAACGSGCRPMLEATARRLQIRILYFAPGNEPEVFGKANSHALLKGKLVEPKAGLRAANPPSGEQMELFDPPSHSGSSSGRATRPRGGAGSDTAEPVGSVQGSGSSGS